ncbi:MAG: carboxymuconolactone decarboxylase family protein [Phycisphaerae bacterium]
MAKDPQSLVSQVKKRHQEMVDGMPEVMKNFSRMMQAAEKDGVLSHKVKELVTLGISIAIRCDYCVAFHVAKCLEAGATREEMMEVCGVAIAMGGGPSYTYTSLVLDAIDAFAEEG